LIPTLSGIAKVEPRQTTLSVKNFVLAHPASRSAIVAFTNGSRGLNVAQRIATAATGLDHAAFWWL
jgi:hypothetical protein